MMIEPRSRFEPMPEWPSLPDGIELGDVAAVAVDRKDQVYLFTRGNHPILVFSSEGELLRSWGHGLFTRPHGLDIGADGAIYCTDDGDHSVRKFDAAGRLLLELGTPGSPAPWMSGRAFNRCTHSALSPNGDIYVSDGYGNAAIHKFDPSGRWLSSWGRPGCDPGQFYLPHNLVTDADGWVYVADRENHRVQIFDGDGRFETEWHRVHRPCGLCLSRANGLFHVAELGSALPGLPSPNIGPRVSLLDWHGAVVRRLDPQNGEVPQLVAPHGIAVDSRGDIYIAELSQRGWSLAYPGQPMPSRLPTVHKLSQVVGESR